MINDIVKQDIAQSFSKAALSYDSAALFQRIAGQRLLERLDFFTLEPAAILDVGCGTGFFTRKLSQRYPQARITGIDVAQGMIDFCRQQSDGESYICADACQLPVAENSYDLIFSNLTIQWIENLPELFQELNRVLKKDGLLLFTTLGPDTLYELKQSWASVDNYQHVNNFLDMHHVGDAMLGATLLDPVVDNEPVIIGYEKVMDLMRDLKNIGAHNLDHNRNLGLTSPRKLKKMMSFYQQFALDDHQLPATYELIYGHAFGSGKRALNYHEYIVELAKQA